MLHTDGVRADNDARIDLVLDALRIDGIILGCRFSVLDQLLVLAGLRRMDPRAVAECLITLIAQRILVDRLLTVGGCQHGRG